MANELAVPLPALTGPTTKLEYSGPISIAMEYIGELSILLGRTVNEILRTGVSAADVIEQMSSLGTTL